MASLNTGTSVVDYIKGTGGDASFASRAAKAAELGIVANASQYTGSAQQNTSLLQRLQSGAASAPAKVNNMDDASKFINAKQDDDIATATNLDEPPVRNVAADLKDAFKTATGKSSLIPSTPAPATPNFEQSFIDLRKQYGVDALESSINGLDAEQQDLEAQLRISKNAELGKPVALGVIEGRVGEQERNMMERIDFVSRQKARAVNQLQSANDSIENVMTFRKMDYDAARDTYNDEFNRNIQLFDTVRSVDSAQVSEDERAQDTARSNLQIIYNSIQDGNTSIDTLDTGTLAKISKMELQAGLPQGFYKNIQAEKPNAKVLSTTTRTAGGVKYADVLYQNPDGSLTTQSVQLGASGSGTGGTGITAPSVSWEEYLSAAEQELTMSIAPDSKTYQDLQAQWKKDYPSTSGLGFTPTEIKKLEQAGLLDATRQEQLDHLYGDESGGGDNPFN
jgi:hypothetical protein